MRLSNWQLLMLGIPLIIGGIVYMFSDDIVKNMHFLFPEYQEQSASVILNKKADIYLEIEKKSSLYSEIEAKMAARQLNARWITDTILYTKQRIDKLDVQKRAWKLEMSYPKKNIAIINGKLTRINEMVDGAKVIKIENLKVLLKHNERLEWVTLFQ